MTSTNMRAIQTVTVGAGGAADIEFTAIPQTYTDLMILISARSTYSSGALDYVMCRVNGDTTSAYTTRKLSVEGASGASSELNPYTVTTAWAFTPMNTATSTSNTFCNSKMYIPRYTSSTFKTASVDFISENDSASGQPIMEGINSHRWSNTNAITSIRLYSVNSSNFAQYSTATLYGVTSAGINAKATGGAIYQDTNYFYHVFTSTGVFTPTQSITADCLVIAGGGGSGSGNGGGGGAGGLLLHSSQALTATNYTVTIGAGGAGGTSDAAGTTGSDSQFASLTASKGGGGGGGWNAVTGKNGGSGGGGSGQLTGPNAGGTATSGQGNNGGTGGYYSSQAYGGGGGGASAVGENASAGNPGDGGNGSSTYSSWGLATNTGQNSNQTFYYAGGGGGGDSTGAYLAPGGLGGGGKGGSGGGTVGTAGTANTGGGAGGGGTAAGAGAAGGSGLVIIRYAK